ncbi:MAG: hypothetical protein IKS05_02230 [Oscillospiraceae bacterium]|nr:hypothetical protein [Oscillospiraceae bacterium]
MAHTVRRYTGLAVRDACRRAELGGGTMGGINKRILFALAAAYAVSGALHVLLYNVDYLDGFSDCFCCVLILVWALSVRKRVTQRQLRALLMAVAALLIVYICLQLCRYLLVRRPLWANRWLWYAYYIPMNSFPVLILALALRIYRPADKPLGPLFRAAALLFALFTLGVLTNDLHFWFKSFPSGVLIDDGREVSGWLYYALSVCTYASYILSFLIILRKSRRFGGQGWRWLPLVPLAAGILYFLLYPLDLGHRWFGTRQWNMDQMLTLCLVSALECCIQTGLIPANTDYDRLFSLAKLPAVILDRQGRPKYITAAGSYPLPDSPDWKKMTHPIPGGSIEWAVDLSPLLRLNRELEEAARSIEARNAYLAEQTKVRAQRTELETRNRIYDQVFRAVKPQLDQIDALLEDRAIPFDQRLHAISICSVFIKRRSNLELLSTDGRLAAAELQLAVSETVTYLRLAGVEAVVYSEGNRDYPAALVITAYEQLQRVIETCGASLSRLLVFLQPEPGVLTMRLLLQAEDFTMAEPGSAAGNRGFSRTVSVTKSGPDLLLVFRYEEGGGAL